MRTPSDAPVSMNSMRLWRAESGTLGSMDDEDVGLTDEVYGGLDVGDRLAEPHDVGAEERAVGGFGAVSELPAVEGVYEVGIAAAAHFFEFTVEMEDMGASGALVEVVDVLGDDADVVVALEVGESVVAGVGRGLVELFAAGVVEIVHQAGVTLPGFGGAHVLDAVFLPEAVAVAEGADAALGAHARTCQYY